MQQQKWNQASLLNPVNMGMYYPARNLRMYQFTKFSLTSQTVLQDIYEPQFSCIGAKAAVSLHFIVITQTFPWAYCQPSTNFVQSFFSICHLCVAMVHTIQSVT
jgi:hypothetical protein